MLMLRGRAEWEPFTRDHIIIGFYCSKCYHAPKVEWLKFCPNCGRKMIHSILLIKDGERIEDDEERT